MTGTIFEIISSLPASVTHNWMAHLNHLYTDQHKYERSIIGPIRRPPQYGEKMYNEVALTHQTSTGICIVQEGRKREKKRRDNIEEWTAPPRLAGNKLK